MKPINLASKSAEVKIICELEVLQHGCSARTIEPQDICDALDRIENALGVPKCRLNGTLVTVDVHGKDFPRSYTYTPQSTIFDAVNVKGKWHIIDIRRGPCHRYKDRVRCSLSEDAKAAVADRFSRFCI